MTTTSPSYTTSSVKRRKRWPWVLAGLLLVGGAGLGIWKVRSNATQSTTTTQTTTTASATQGTLRVSVSGPGTLEANATRTVGADLTATVGSVPAVGEHVTKGQLITSLTSDTVQDNVKTAQLNLQKAQASLDSTRANQASSAAQRQSSVASAQSNVTQAQQTLADAQRTLTAQQQLHAIGAASTQDLSTAQDAVSKAQLTLDSARASYSAAQTQLSTGSSSDTQNIRNGQIAVEQARASLDTAQRAAAKLKVYAPISGVISSVNATEGTVVTAGGNILTLLDDTTLNLPVQIDETEISGVKVGQQAEVTLDAYDGQTFYGKVIRVSPGASQSNGISVFTATVQLGNQDGKLRSGMTAQAEIIQSEERGLIIPAKAVQTVRNRSYVQIPAPAGNADGVPVGQPMRVRVQTGATDGTDIIVTDGLQAGQEVIVVGAKKTTSTSTTGSSNRSNQGGFSGGPPPGGF